MKVSIFLQKIFAFLGEIVKFLWMKSKEYRFISIGVLTLMIVFFLARYSFNYIKPRNYTIGKYYSEGGAMTTNWITQADKTFKNAPKQLNILQLYNKIVRQRKTFHKSIVINLLTANEVLIFISILCGSISLVILTLIAGDGWKNVDIGYKSVFTTTALLSALSFSIMKTYQIEENIAFNFAQYKAYDRIQLDIVNHISSIGLKTDTNSKIIQNPSFQSNCDSLVRDINRKIYEATDVKITIDLSSIKMAQIISESKE
jgi:hypothetical protein